MKEIKIAFKFFWKPFDLDQFKSRFLFLKKYKLILSDNPDIIFFSHFGGGARNTTPLFKSKAIRVFYHGENFLANINNCDYAIGSRRELINHNNYLYLPPYLTRLSIFGFKQEDLIKNINVDTIQKPKFCNFIYSHNVKRRNNFFNLLSKYKNIDSPGKSMNNMKSIGKTVKDKLDFQRQYKFSIAFENSTANGYLCEKISDPMLVNSIPIYWGDTHVHEHFNEDSFINCMKFKNDKEIIDYIIEIDKNNNLYKKILKEPWFKDNKIPEDSNMKKTEDFFERIFNVL